MGKNNYVSGCPDPYSLAEEISGKRINWEKEKDEFDALAKAFGITKEGYLRDASPLMNPYVTMDGEGNVKRLSDQEAKERLSSYLEKNARPEKKVRRKIDNSVSAAGEERKIKRAELTEAEKRRRVIDTLIPKKTVPSIKPRKIDLEQGGGTPVDDTPFSMSGFEWRDKGYFFNETALWSDVCQNGIGDCYFLAALCSVAYVDSFRIKNVTGLRYKYQSKEGLREFAPWHAIDFYIPSNGTSDLRNWGNKKKSVETVVVSEEILVNKATGYNYGASGPKEKIEGKVTGSKADLDSNWAAVYEKAYAKFLERNVSDYPNMGRNSLIWFGCADEALKEIIHTEQVTSKSTDNMSINDIWNLGMKARNHPSCATISQQGSKIDINGEEIGYSKAGTDEEYRAMGLYIRHVYSFLGVYSNNDTKYIVLRNPHGRNPLALKNNPKVYHKYWGFNFGVDPRDKYDDLWDVYRNIDGNDNPLRSNGVFLLEINEFKRVFTSVEYYNGSAFLGTV